MAAKTFKNLLVWQESYKLALSVYKVTAVFPREERYGLSSQLKRAIVSVSFNIAEGFGRNGAREKDQFYGMAHGSLTEVENQLLIARGVGYISEEQLKHLEKIFSLTQKLLSGLQRANRQKGAEATILKSRI